MLILSIIYVVVYVIIALRTPVSFLVLSSEPCLLASIVDLMMSNCSSDLLSILFPPFGILNIYV